MQMRKMLKKRMSRKVCHRIRQVLLLSKLFSIAELPSKRLKRVPVVTDRVFAMRLLQMKLTLIFLLNKLLERVKRARIPNKRYSDIILSPSHRAKAAENGSEKIESKMISQ
ncbi:hypothetical protein NQ317_005778 [Molorchus minor]|uniref:Uncharacterized protein n=1 Tax=Molorchus minor TaxID=1323400 RepID=A0ABQ9JA61_9CUCU|nr:hypothetical protein NQ317_005778 [Molorchus minor]